MADLSPQAQAVYDALPETVDWSCDREMYRTAAAVLRAAVEQCSHADRTGSPYITPADLLDIARELEQAP